MDAPFAQMALLSSRFISLPNGRGYDADSNNGWARQQPRTQLMSDEKNELYTTISPWQNLISDIFSSRHPTLATSTVKDRRGIIKSQGTTSRELEGLIGGGLVSCRHRQLHSTTNRSIFAFGIHRQVRCLPYFGPKREAPQRPQRPTLSWYSY